MPASGAASGRRGDGWSWTGRRRLVTDCRLGPGYMRLVTKPHARQRSRVGAPWRRLVVDRPPPIGHGLQAGPWIYAVGDQTACPPAEPRRGAVATAGRGPAATDWSRTAGRALEICGW